MAEFKNSKKFEKNSGGTDVSTKALDNAIYGIIAAIFFLCPIFFTGLVSQGVGFEKMALLYFLVLLGSVIWVTKGVFKGELDIKRTPLDIPLLVIFALFSVSTLLSVSRNDSVVGAYGSPSKGLIALVIFILFYYLVANNIDTKRVKLYFASFVSSMILLVLYSFLQLRGLYILPFPFSKNASFNPIGSLSGLTMALAIVLPLLTVAVAQVSQIFSGLNKSLTMVFRVFLSIGLLATLVVLAMLNVFTFWLAVIISSVVVLVFFMAKIIPINTGGLLIPAGVFFASIVFFVIGNFSLIQMNLPTEISLSRGASWEIAKSSLKDNPIFGSGPSTFYYSFSKYKSIDFNGSPLWNVRFDSASGAVFELLSTVGVLGTLALVVLVLIVFSLSFLTLIKTKNKELNPIMLGLFSSFVSIMILSLMFAQNNSIIILNILLGVLTISTALTIYPEKFKNINLSFRAAPKYALALAAISLTVFAGVVVLFTIGLKTYMADMHAKEALAATNIEDKIVSLTKAVSLAPYQDKYFLSLANSYISQANKAVVDGKDVKSINAKLKLSIDNGKKAVDISGNSASNNEALALIYENASFYTRGALDWAEELYKDIILLEPTNPTPYMRIALVNMARANTETDEGEKEFYINEAIAYYDKTIDKKPDLAAAHYGKAVAHEKLDNIDLSIEEMRKVTSIANNNIDYQFELGRLLFNRGIASAGIRQTATQNIAVNDIEKVDDGIEEEGEGELPTEELSVVPVKETNTTIIEKNNDLAEAESRFVSILVARPNHANALYSLAVLYKKIGEDKNLKVVLDKLMEIITDQATKDAIAKQFPEAR